MHIIGKARRLGVLAHDALRSLFERGYRIRFVNFWLSGKDARKLWFYPLIEDACAGLDPKRECRISELRPQVLVASVLGDARKVDRARGRCKIFFSGECVRPRKQSDWEEYRDYRAGSFDLSLGFDPASSVGRSNYLRLPLWILYYFSALDTKDQVAAKVKAINVREQVKTKFCAIVARHDKNGIRTEIADAVSSIGHVDSAGSWRHNDDSLGGLCGDDKIAYLGPYRFNICPENTQGEGYVTEKLFQAYESGCIPIYNGYCDDPEPEVIDRHTLIFWKEGEANVEALAKIKELHANEPAYMEFMARQPLMESSVDFIWNTIQRVKERISEIIPRSVSRARRPPVPE